MLRLFSRALFWVILATFAGAPMLTADQPPGTEDGPVVIVHPATDVSGISRAELSKIFLKRLRTWSSGQIAVPVDQAPQNPARQVFSEKVHGRSVVNIEVYWKRMIFSGRSLPPRELASDTDVLDFVRSTPGAVGYVGSGADLEGVDRLDLER